MTMNTGIGIAMGVSGFLMSGIDVCVGYHQIGGVSVAVMAKRSS